MPALVPALVVTLVVAAAVAAYAFVRYDRFESADPGRSTVIATAEQFALRMDAIDGSDVDGYTKKVMAMLTTKAKSEFKQQFEALKTLQTDAKLKGAGKVLVSGVTDLDNDSATVLVVHDSATTSSQDPTLNHYRWVVSLQKVGGKWLVDDFNPVS